KGLYEVFSPEQGKEVGPAPGQWSLMQTHDGNYDLRLPLEGLHSQMEAVRSGNDRITAAVYDEKQDELWVGTRRSGLFRFKTKPALQLVRRYHEGNSKIPDNRINTLLLDSRGWLWVGTYDGTFFKKGNDWEVKEKGFSFSAFAQNGTDVWAMGDNLLWKVNARAKWEPVDIDESLMEGDVADIAFDQNGLLWVVSQILARFDPATEEATVFGPAIGFTSQDVSCVAVDQDNGVWIGTNDKGLYLIQKAVTLYVACDVVRPVSCDGDASDGALKVSVSGGEPPYTFEWADGLTGETPTGLAPGRYSVTVTDSRGKRSSASVVLKNPLLRVQVEKGRQAGSEGMADGSATVKVSGGQPPYSYMWDSGETAATAFKLGEGAHTVTVTDKNGCTQTGQVGIGREVAALSIAISQTKKIKCANGQTAAIQVEVSGGKAPYTYQWNGGGLSGEKATDLPAGNYSVTVSDATGQTAMATIAIEAPAPLEVTARVDAPAGTGSEDGRATAAATGGTPPYQYAWSNGETAAQAVRLGPADHSVTVTDAAGCEAVATVKISENILPLSIAISQTKKIKCADEKTAALEAAIQGGKGPFRFAWSTGNDTAVVSALPAGEYAVTVTDATGTTAQKIFTVKAPKPITVSAGVKSAANTGKADGKALAKAVGGTGKLTWQWSNGETGKEATRLAPGQHSVTVTDQNGCTAEAVVDVSENILPLDAKIALVNPIQCAGDKNAALKVETQGGKPPYSYAWNHSDLRGDSPANLAPGRYVVTITDAAGQEMSTGFEITEPAPLKVVLIKNRPSTTEKSKNGRAAVRAQGGTPLSDAGSNYLYQWDNGETGPTAENLSGGYHTVTATDANGCTAQLAVETKIRIIPELSADNLRKGATIKLNKIYFQPDSTRMDPSSIPTVDELFEFLKEHPNIVIEVGGHTNGIPSNVYCDRLSTERAKNVAQYLVDKGIPASQLRYKGYGKRKPVATNATPEGRAKNQRVEIKVLSTGGKDG
ncbi:MAG TPA: hypothetical protein ENJ20_05010, partial [Bacteroidetes bacterium]|nr:hypothetical protein [Bacteroidota bacterium]